MLYWTKIKNFVIKYWQWLLMIITAIAFYLLGMSKDAKEQQVQFYEKWKDLEKKEQEKLIEGLEDLQEDKEASKDENILNFEQKKKEILEGAKDIETENFLESKGIQHDED